MPRGVYERKPRKRAYKRRAPPTPTTSALIHLERAALLMPPPGELTECHLEMLHALRELRGGLDT